MTIKDQAEDLIEGIKEKFECDEHEDCDGIHLDDRIAEKAREIIKFLGPRESNFGPQGLWGKKIRHGPPDNN